MPSGATTGGLGPRSDLSNGRPFSRAQPPESFVCLIEARTGTLRDPYCTMKLVLALPDGVPFVALARA